MCDHSYKTIYILKTYPLNKVAFIISLNNINIEKPLSFFLFLGGNHLNQYIFFYVNLNLLGINLIIKIIFKYNLRSLKKKA